MNKSRFYRIFISYIVVVFLLSIFVLSFITSLVKDQYINNKIENMTYISLIIQETIQRYIEGEDWHELDLFVKEISQQTETRISVIHPDGKVIAESLKDFQEMENHRNRPEIRAALQGEKSHTVRYSTTAREDMLYVSSPIFSEGRIIAVLRLSIFIDKIQHILNRTRNTILMIALLMILLSFGISYYIAKRLTIPTQKLVQAFDRVSEGNLETRLLAHREEPEIKELSDRFNKMIEQLKQFMKNISLQTEELETIISTIDSGIVLLDEKGEIILSNKYFKECFSSKVTNKYFWEVIRDGRLNEQISELIEKKKNFSREIELSEKYYLCNGTYIDKKNKSVLIFHDITRSRKLTQVKKDLIDNISHELRTPLTSIKGYTETMEGATDKEREKYIQIIKRNTERLISMVDDLLSLSELEDKGGKMQIEKVHLEEIMENMRKIFEPAIKKKQLSLNFDIQAELPEIEADSYKIEQMLINLIDNAIKYTEKGEINILVELTTASKVKIEVADTGIGIKKEELNSIFERFYVVNKARSRQYGGTGLGLSIVKHIVMLHQGKIEIDSQLGVGTRLAVILPVQQP